MIRPERRIKMGNNFAQTKRLTIVNLRRDWLSLLIWTTSIIGVYLLAAFKFNDLYGSNSSIKTILKTLKQPAMISLFGRTPNLTSFQSGDLFISEMLVLTGVFISIADIILAVRTTRSQEDKGVIEIIRGTAVGRLSPLLSAFIEILIFNLLLIILLAVGLEACGLYGMTATMCWLFAIETNLLALVFAGLAFLMAQIFDNSRDANAVSFLFLGIACLSRMITDISKASLTWLSPIGWVELGKIGYGNDLKVVWLMLLSILILLFLAIIFALKRDINSGFLHIRSGRKNASPLLRGPISLGIRLERNLGIVWIIAIASLGIMYASIFSDVSDILKSNPNVAQVLGTNQLSQLGNKIVLQFISMISIFMLVLSTVAGLQMIFRLKKDIDTGLEEMIASKPISRFRLLTSYLLPAIIVTICSFGSSIYSMMLLGNLELKVPIESIKFNTLFFGSLPSAMLFLSLAVFLINCFPKIYSILYVYAGLSFVVLYFKNMLKLPIWVTRITPFGWIKDLPLKDINWEIWYFEVLLVLIFTFIGYFEFQRRDLS